MDTIPANPSDFYIGAKLQLSGTEVVYLITEYAYGDQFIAIDINEGTGAEYSLFNRHADQFNVVVDKVR